MADTNGINLTMNNGPEKTPGGEGTTYDPEEEAKLKEATNVKTEKRRIIKNMLVISLAFLFNFNAFQGLSRLQSSLHRVEGMGVIASSVVYASLMVSCMFAPKILINFIGHKWTIAISFSGYILWMAANGYAVWGTLITGSILVGLFAAPLWTAQCSYFTIGAQNYAKLSNEKEEAVVSRFFGVFFMFFQLSSITGSIISSTVLRPVVVDNETAITDLSICGTHDCPANNVTNANLAEISKTTISALQATADFACAKSRPCLHDMMCNSFSRVVGCGKLTPRALRGERL